MRTISKDEKVFLGADINGHIGRKAYSYSLVHEGFGFSVRNKSGENQLMFALAKELAIANSNFRKKYEHLITYKSGSTQRET